MARVTRRQLRATPAGMELRLLGEDGQHVTLVLSAREAMVLSGQMQAAALRTPGYVARQHPPREDRSKR